MSAVDELTAWVRTMQRPGAALVPTDGWQFAELDASRSRRAAVLMLFGSRADSVAVGGRPVSLGASPDHRDLDLLFVRRASTLTHHPGQVAFPGGGIDATDPDEAGAALREAEEETGLDPTGVDVIGMLPEVGLPVSNFLVTPVLGWWREESAVHAVDSAESQSVFRCPVTTLLSADTRRTAVLRRDGFTSRTPAFVTPDAVIWGFTAMLLDAMFDGLGWAPAWDRTLEVPAPL